MLHPWDRTREPPTKWYWYYHWGSRATKNCPDLPIIRCFTLGIEPENPLQSGTGITTEAAGLLKLSWFTHYQVLHPWDRTREPPTKRYWYYHWGSRATKNCPDLPIIRCFTLGIEPENPLQSGTGITTEAAGLLKNCPDLPIIRCFTLGIEPENPLQSGTGITTEAAGLLNKLSWFTHYQVLHPWDRTREPPTKRYWYYHWGSRATKQNCPDLPIIRCFTLGIEPENPLQSGTGITTEAAGLLKNCPDLPIIRCFTLGIEPENPLQSGTGITTEAAGLLNKLSWFTHYQVLHPWDRTREPPTKRYWYYHWGSRATKQIVLIYPLSGASPLGSNPRTPYKAVLVLPLRQPGY